LQTDFAIPSNSDAIFSASLSDLTSGVGSTGKGSPSVMLDARNGSLGRPNFHPVPPSLANGNVRPCFFPLAARREIVC
jgi:hypothetical protein